MKYLILVLGLLFVTACADAPDVSAPDVEVDQTSQALIGQWCANHPVQCQTWCDNHPRKCRLLCLFRPNLPVCDDADAGTGPQCLALGQTCVDEEDPNYVPCCGFEDGLADCYRNDAIQSYTCQETTPACEGPVSGQVCDPNGVPCCPSPNPNDPPVLCQISDPNDPDARYNCTPQ